MPKQEQISQDEINLINEISQFELDPYGYVLYVYPWEVPGTELENQPGPDEWQTEVLLDIGDKLQKGLPVNFSEVIREAVASGHGVGKSALVAWLVDWAMDTREFTRGVVTANTDTQLRTKTWPEVQKWSRLRITSHWTTVTATAIYSNVEGCESNWRIDAIPWSKENPEAFAGLHNKGNRIIVIFDEASAVYDLIWEVSEGAMTDEGTQIIWCVFGNPTRNTGRFRECWKRFRKLWTCWEVDSRNARMSNKTLIQQWIDTYGIDSDFVKVRVRGMFPSMSAKQYISTADVDPAFGKHLNESQYNFAAKIISVEPAWEGDDNLEIGIRQGLAFRILRTIPKNDNDFQIANIVANYEDSERADGVVIDGGFGTGIISAGRTMGRNWMVVWYSSESPDPSCLNMRAYIWMKMKEWLKSGGAIPSDQGLYDDLIGPEIVARPDGKLQLEAKKDMKARGIPSPNKGDCLAQTFAYDIQPKRGSYAQPNNFAQANYDVLGKTPGNNQEFAKGNNYNPLD